MKLHTIIRLAAAATLVWPLAAPAQQIYPDRPVTVIIPAAAGNSPDVAARLIAERLGDLWKQQVVVINRPGAEARLPQRRPARRRRTATRST